MAKLFLAVVLLLVAAACQAFCSFPSCSLRGQQPRSRGQEEQEPQIWQRTLCLQAWGGAGFGRGLGERPVGQLWSMASASAALVKEEKEEEDAQRQRAREAVDAATEKLLPTFHAIDKKTQVTLRKVLEAFREARVDPNNFAGVDGYGHGDIGRDALGEIYATLFKAESALIRVQCFSGTHAIACALFGVLRPGHKMLAISGPPYDTLDEVIGTRLPAADTFAEDPLSSGLVGNLGEFGVSYQEVPLTDEGLFNLQDIDAALHLDPSIRLLHIQRSCGYQWRPSIPIAEIERLVRHIDAEWAHRRSELVIFVDNCYGEFVEEREPTAVGVDLIAGSLIKNPGGTLVKSGGYVAGKRDLVRAASNRMGAPGVDGGATLGQNSALYQGLFLAPTMVGESLKGAHLLAEVFAQRGMPTNPPRGGEHLRTDIIQAIQLGSRSAVVDFCQVVQKFSPVGAHYKPVPGSSPGYGDEVIFADGTFVDGSTLELSADGPLREPFVVFAQGCTHWSHWAIILEEALLKMDAEEPHQ